MEIDERIGQNMEKIYIYIYIFFVLNIHIYIYLKKFFLNAG